MSRPIIAVLGEGENQAICENLSAFQDMVNESTILSEHYKERLRSCAKKIMDEAYKIGRKNPI